VSGHQGDSGLRWPMLGAAGGLLMIPGSVVIVAVAVAMGSDAPTEVPPGAVGVDPVVLAAYTSAADQASELVEGCRLRWQVLAGIGKVESNNAGGRTVAANGDVSPPIVGIALDGSRGTMAIADSDGGAWDGDTTWDRAVGPMQFIPSSWRAYGADGNGDGALDPHNVVDAALGAAAHLCGTNPADFADRAQLASALRRYNNSQAYVEEVLSWVDFYDQLGSQLSIPSPDGLLSLVAVGGITVAAHVAPYLESMLAAADADGLVLTGSGYRPTQRQVELRRINGCPDVWTSPASSCRVPTAIPGRSMHEIGEAVDFDNCASSASRCFAWLRANAGRFGFFNLKSEPWHWSRTGG
jgi:hypothetical protein